LNVKRSINSTDVEFKLDGYETRLITLSKELNLVSIINLGNLLGWAIDALSGSLMRYDKRSYEITMNSKKTSMLKPNRIEINTYTKTVDLYVTEE
jgi:hypothetical protein